MAPQRACYRGSTLNRCFGRRVAVVLLATLFTAPAPADILLEHINGLPGTFFNPALSGDGQWIVWKAAQSPPVIGVQNLRTGAQALLDLHSTTGDTGLKFKAGGYLSVSYDGSRIVVGTADDGFSVPNIALVVDATGAEIARLTVLAENTAPVGISNEKILIDKSGRYVVFSVGRGLGGDSILTSVIAGGGGDIFTSTEVTRDVFSFDTVSGDIALASVGSDGNETDNHTEALGISDGGRYVLLWSNASNLPGEDGTLQVYVRDMTLSGFPALEQVSVDPDGEVFSNARLSYMSDDGARVMVPRLANQSPDNLPHTYLWERGKVSRELTEYTNSDFHGRHLSGDGKWAVGGRDVFSRFNVDTGHIDTFTSADDLSQTLLDKNPLIQSNNGNILLFNNVSLTRPPDEDGTWWILRYLPPDVIFRDGFE